jgi:hypothetical protein
MSTEHELRVVERLCHVIACVMYDHLPTFVNRRKNDGTRCRRLSKGFTSTTLVASGCQPLFLGALDDFLSALALPMQRSLIHSSMGLTIEASHSLPLSPLRVQVCGYSSIG